MVKKENFKEDLDFYRKNINNLKNEISKACNVAGRNCSDVLIIAAAKYADALQIKKVMEIGIMDFGENRAGDLLEKYNYIGEKPTWHFIGHLQSRKVKIVIPIVEYIHSIDKISTIGKVNNEASKINKVQKVLVEVNVSGEESKYGIKPCDLMDFLSLAKDFINIKLVGLMTVAPFTNDVELIRKIFRNLKILLQKSNDNFKDIMLTELSMGMSNDYEIAIEEGATMIRIGSSIFK